MKEYDLKNMSAKIINFPSDKKLQANKPLYNSYSSTETVGDVILHIPNRNHESFEKRWLSKKTSEEMFPADYFMLVE